MSRRRPPHIVLASRIARLLACTTLALVAFVATPSSGRSPVSRFDALPRPDERLPQPIWLPHCGMRIVEWRSTAALHTETAPSDQALATIDETCRDAFDRYGEFLRAKKLPRLHAQPDMLPAISMLPGNTLLDGKSGRALNDIPSRFEAVALNHLFLRNDPLIKDVDGALVANPRFVRTLTHEISHVLSSRLGVWDVVGYDRQRDEDLAEEFVTYMGMRFPAESSAEDLAFHRGHAPRPAAPAPVAAAATHPAKPAVAPAAVATTVTTARASANTSAQR
jgi:hypothetical protein